MSCTAYNLNMILFSSLHMNNTYIVHVHFGFLAKTSDGLRCINKLLFTFFKTDKQQIKLVTYAVTRFVLWYIYV